MDRIEAARAALLQRLETAGIATDPTATARRYGDGLAYAVPADTARNQPVEFQVIVALAPARSVDVLTALAEKAIAAIEASAGAYSVLEMAPEYNAEPLPGREMPPADLYRLRVQTNTIVV